MVEHVLDAAEAAGCRDNVVVIGHGAELVKPVIGERARLVLQAEQLGTGHAVLQAADALKGFTGTVMIRRYAVTGSGRVEKVLCGSRSRGRSGYRHERYVGRSFRLWPHFAG